MHEKPAKGGLMFARYWAANAVSGFGTYVLLLALQALVVVQLGGSALDVGWLNAARWLPWLAFGLIVGALVDRLTRRRPVLVTAHLAQAAFLALIPLAWAMDWLTLPVLLVLVMLVGTAALFDAASEMALLPRIVPRSRLQSAHAKVDGTDAVAQNAGPALGGALASWIGAPLTILTTSFAHLVSAAFVASIRVDEPAPAKAEKRRLTAEIRDGLRWVYRHGTLRSVAISTHIWFAGQAILGAVLAVWALRALGLTAFQFGLAVSAAGLGALVGALLTTSLGRRFGAGPVVIGCNICSAIGVVVMIAAVLVPADSTGHWGAWAVLAVGQFAHGLAMGASNSHEMSFRQAITPDELQGRVNTSLRSLNRGVIVIAAPLGGLLADTAGLIPALWVTAAIFFVAALVLVLSPFRREPSVT